MACSVSLIVHEFSVPEWKQPHSVHWFYPRVHIQINLYSLLHRKTIVISSLIVVFLKLRIPESLYCLWKVMGGRQLSKQIWSFSVSFKMWYLELDILLQINRPVYGFRGGMKRLLRSKDLSFVWTRNVLEFLISGWHCPVTSALWFIISLGSFWTKLLLCQVVPS